MDSETLDEYADELFGSEDSVSRRMREEAHEMGIPPIQVPSDLGRLLTLLINITRPRRVLEIGTLFGYSSVLMARALPDGGHITTLEVSSKHAQVARSNFDRAGVADRVTVIEGNALDTLVSLDTEPFDLIFIDADKPGYPNYLDAALRVSRPGTVIVADNVWRDGAVLHPDDDGTAALARFNQNVASHSSLLSAIVATRGCSDAAMVSVVR
jgi:predicted O-methyltransferase YrrM